MRNGEEAEQAGEGDAESRHFANGLEERRVMDSQDRVDRVSVLL